MRKLNGTKVGNIVNLMIEGNTYQKRFETQDEANAFFKLMQKAREGDQSAYDELLSELSRRFKTVIKDVLEKDADDVYYLKGIDIPMPTLLAETFLDYLNNNYPITALSNFWKLLITNPDKRVRADLFEFLQNYQFAITDFGYFIAYKAVLVKEEASEHNLASFITNQYLKIKKWKKNPANYDVVQILSTEEVEILNPDYDEDDAIHFGDDYNQEEYIYENKTVSELKLIESGTKPANGKIEKKYGNLLTLFKGIDSLVESANHTIYESKHSGKNGRVQQKLGVPVKMDRIETNRDPKIECSSGLHVGSTKYVEGFSNSDDKILLVLVNPAHVVAVPEYDNSKLRTCEYFPYAELERLGNGKFEIVEEPYFEEDYIKYEAADLEKAIEVIQSEIDQVTTPDKQQLDYKKILENRLLTIEDVLNKK